jgi:hypothetical protein
MFNVLHTKKNNLLDQLALCYKDVLPLHKKRNGLLDQSNPTLTLPLQYASQPRQKSTRMIWTPITKAKKYEQMSHWKRPRMMWKEGSHP